MTDKRSDGNDRDDDRSTPPEREQQDHEPDDRVRRRDQSREAQLTNRERQERWPISLPMSTRYRR